MTKAIPWILLVALISCAPAAEEAAPVAEAEAPEAPVEVVESYPDPEPEAAQEVQDLLSGWVAERSGEDGVYAIPPRAGHEVNGTMGDFHTVHQKDADTYSVCVDFNSGDRVYDVDFFVDRTAEGLVVADHYLHKIDGEAVE